VGLWGGNDWYANVGSLLKIQPYFIRYFPAQNVVLWGGNDLYANVGSLLGKRRVLFHRGTFLPEIWGHGMAMICMIM